MEQDFFKNNDMQILKSLITPNASKDEFYKQSDEEYKELDVSYVSHIEYKSMIFNSYFIEALMKNGLQFWPMYEKSIAEAEKYYQMTVNVTQKVEAKRNEKKV